MDNIPLKERTPEAKAAYREGFNAAVLMCADLAVRKSELHSECDYRGAQDHETGEISCSRRDGCLCDDLCEHGQALAKVILNRHLQP